MINAMHYLFLGAHGGGRGAFITIDMGWSPERACITIDMGWSPDGHLSLTTRCVCVCVFQSLCNHILVAHQLCARQTVFAWMACHT